MYQGLIHDRSFGPALCVNTNINIIVLLVLVYAKPEEDGAPYGHMISVSQPLAHMHADRDIVIPVSGAQAARVYKGKIPTRRMLGNGGGEQGRGGAA